MSDEQRANPLPGEPSPDLSGKSETVWTFRGYRIKSGEFNTAMAHFYRGEMYRSNVWRQRLDNTTNWAVATTGAALSFAFSNPSHHLVIPLVTLMVTLFLFIEARRYRYYELWAYRVRLMETDFYAAMLVPPFGPDEHWAAQLADSLLYPEFPIPFMEALGRRFRRNYWAIFIVLALSWLLKSVMFPVPVSSWSEIIARFDVGPLPGGVVLAAGIIYNGALFLMGLLTSGMNKSVGEILPRYGAFSPTNWFQAILTATVEVLPKPGGWRPRFQRDCMALIVTDKGNDVAELLLNALKRGVTRLTGEGMYTHRAHDVLVCTVAPRQVAHLKALVRQADPAAFVIVNPAEAFGQGFKPL